MINRKKIKQGICNTNPGNVIKQKGGDKNVRAIKKRARNTVAQRMNVVVL